MIFKICLAHFSLKTYTSCYLKETHLPPGIPYFALNYSCQRKCHECIYNSNTQTYGHHSKPRESLPKHQYLCVVASKENNNLANPLLLYKQTKLMVIVHLFCFIIYLINSLKITNRSSHSSVILVADSL